jgi:hypothetical protein
MFESIRNFIPKQPAHNHELFAIDKKTANKEIKPKNTQICLVYYRNIKDYWKTSNI